jgi:hypothetical protein
MMTQRVADAAASAAHHSTTAHAHPQPATPRATLHARSKILSRIALERNGENPIWQRANARLEQVDRALRQEFGFSGARSCDDASAARLTERAPSLGFEVLYSSRPPVVRPNAWHD